LLSSNTAPTSAFTVLKNNNADSVTSVNVDTNAKTVTLKLTNPAINGDIFTLAYTDPTTNDDANAIQDAAGNDAASLPTHAVTNTTPDVTPPVFASAAVNGNTLVLTYTDDNLLSNSTASTSAFRVLKNNTANAITAVSVDINAKTVTLTLTNPAVNGDTVTVAYTDPTVANDINAIQDATGNDATSLPAHTVTNTTPDVTPPVFASATVNGSTLVLTYTDTNLLGSSTAPTSAFTILKNNSANAVTAVSVDINAKTVTLTLTNPVIDGDTVTVAYTDPSAANDANAIQDATGNDAASLPAHAVTNNSPDVTPPVFASAAVNGSTLVLSYTDTNLLSSNAASANAFTVLSNGNANTVTAVSINTSAKTLTLTLTSPVVEGDTVTVAYTDPTANNDANAIQDATGNDATSLPVHAVTNNTPDVTPPIFGSAAVNGSTLVLTYTDANLLSSGTASISAFTVLKNNNANAVTAVSVDTNAKTVTLTLTSPVVSGDTVTVAYTDPTANNDANAIQDAAGNDAVSLPAHSVTNNTTTPSTIGKVWTDFNHRNDIAYDALVQSDGKVVAIGKSDGTGYFSSDDNFLLVRYNTDSTLDTTYGTAGKVTYPSSGTTIGAYLQSDGKILVTGSSATGFFILMRFNIDGSLDTSFNPNYGLGIYYFSTNLQIREGVSIAIQSDNKIVVSGMQLNSGHDFFIARFNSDGTPDLSFDTDGWTNIGISSYGYPNTYNSADDAYSVSIQTDNKIIIQGTSSQYNGSTTDKKICLVRYNSDGSLDTTFGSNGILSPNIPLVGYEGYSSVIQSDGKILVSAHNSSDNFALLRYNSNGNIDSSFANNGTLLTSLSAVHSVTVDQNGKIYLAEQGQTGNNTDFTILSYDADGTLDTNFGTGGETHTVFNNHPSNPYKIILDNNKIVVVGTVLNLDYDFAVARYNIDGTIDTNFGL
jgi:uncharacterized repeat protein (TIGR02059 family)/uncharacterized delta-60 repeat protein